MYQNTKLHVESLPVRCIDGHTSMNVDIIDYNTCNSGPVDGNWGSWSYFGKCSVSCGRGEMMRTRDCNSPPPSNGGRMCVGQGQETRRCEDRKCPGKNNVIVPSFGRIKTFITKRLHQQINETRVVRKTSKLY